MKRHPSVESLRPFFEPASVAVIGASRTPGKGGYNIIENLRRLGYKGRVYPVNPGAREVQGLPAFPDPGHIPAVPDLAIIVLPPAQVLKSLEACIGAGIKSVIIEAAGFGETDAAGARLEARLQRLAGAGGIRFMGPNSVGTINPAARFDASLGRLNELFLPQDDIREGSVGFIGQTGLFTGVFLPLINEEAGISKIACLGNKRDIDESDMLAYFGADRQTRVIAMYLESIKDGRRFLGLARRIVKKKPVIVLKSAVTAAGARASATHTGSLAGADEVYDAAFRQVGIIRVGGFEQLFDVATAFAHTPLPPGDRVAIVNLAGSGCVITVDACAKNGLRVAGLTPETIAAIKPLYPDWWRVRSPVDVWTAVEASGFEKAYTTITRAVLADRGVDAVIVILGANNWLPGRDVAPLFAGIKHDFPLKPILAAAPLGDRDIFNRMRRGFQEVGIPCYTSAEEAVFVLAALNRYRQILKTKTGR